MISLMVGLRVLPTLSAATLSHPAERGYYIQNTDNNGGATPNFKEGYPFKF